MLNLIGIGLGNEKDLTLNALEAIKKSDIIYLENYTSLIGFDIKDLEKLIEKKINLVDRSFVEGEILIEEAKDKDVSILIKGDVFSATTHGSLLLNARENKIKVKIFHNSSILTAIGDTGLSLYKFGKTVSIPFDNKNVNSSYDVFLDNKNMHTLFLLDLKPSENKFMNFKDGLNYLLEKSKIRNDGKFNLNSKCIVCCAIGTNKEAIRYGFVKDLIKLNLDVYPQCFIVPGDLHFMEEEILELYKI